MADPSGGTHQIFREMDKIQLRLDMVFLETTFYNNTIERWLIALLIVLLAYLILLIIKAVAARRLKELGERTKTDIDNLFADLISRVKFIFLFMTALYAGSQYLVLPEKVSEIISVLVVIALLGQGVTWGCGVIEYLVERYKYQKKGEDPAGVTTVAAIGFISKLALWAIILLLVLDNLGIEITGLVAGLGIRRIAVALAV